MTKVVILAAGWGTRMRPLTDTRPKPALKIAGKTLVEHNLDQLVGLVDEAVIVIGYEGNIIKEALGEDYRGVKIEYAEQKEQLGTGDAALAALPFLDHEFLILNGDDLYKRTDLESVLEVNPCIMVKEVENPSGFGQVVCEDGKMKDLVEKPDNNVSNLVNIGAYFVNKDFFEISIKKSQRGEYEITDYIKNYISKGEMCYRVAENWDPVSYPWNLLESSEHIFSEMEQNIQGELEEGVVIKGKVFIGEGTVIRAGTRIEGPAHIGKNCVIGPFASILPTTSIEEECRIGHAVEVKNSVIGKGTKIPHLSYIGDSVLGENCTLGAGVITANLLLKNRTIKTLVKGKSFDTGRRKLGVVLGDDTSVGVGTSFMPGVMVGAGSVIYPHKVIKENLEKNSKKT